MTPDEKSILLVTQFPKGTSINMDEMIQQIKENSNRRYTPWYGMEAALVEQKPVTIRGQETALSISEGTNDKGEPYHGSGVQSDLLCKKVY